MFSPSRANALILTLLACVYPSTALAAGGEIDTGDTAWILVSSALVLFMNIPGLFLFYAGLVQKRNVLSVMMQCFALTAMVTLLWLAFGYSLAFDTSGMVKDQISLNSFIGSFEKVFLGTVGRDDMHGTIPEVLFFMFQMTFAIITPALMVGAFAERMKFSAVIWFSLLWVTFVYLPVCHMVWGGDGALFADRGVIDFAGGIVVHVTAGIGALVACIAVGKRVGYPDEVRRPHNLTMTVTGTAMLWVGWFGFNGGSALAAGADAAMAITVTHISASVGALVWMAIETYKNSKPSVLGAATGSIAGLAAITPAAGSVGPIGALAIGLCSGLLCYYASISLKARFGYDDSLDVFGVHGVGGVVGTLMVAIVGGRALGGTVEAGMGEQFATQATAVCAVALYTAVVSWVLLRITKMLLGSLRISEQQEREGLDIVEHEERGYDL